MPTSKTFFLSVATKVIKDTGQFSTDLLPPLPSSPPLGASWGLLLINEHNETAASWLSWLKETAASKLLTNTLHFLPSRLVVG